MIEAMTAMANATLAIVRAFMGRLQRLQQRSRRPYSVSLALTPPSQTRRSSETLRARRRAKFAGGLEHRYLAFGVAVPHQLPAGCLGRLPWRVARLDLPRQ